MIFVSEATQWGSEEGCPSQAQHTLSSAKVYGQCVHSVLYTAGEKAVLGVSHMDMAVLVPWWWRTVLAPL